MTKRKKDKQWFIKHYKEKEKLSNTNPTKHRVNSGVNKCLDAIIAWSYTAFDKHDKIVCVDLIWTNTFDFIYLSLLSISV